MSVKIKVGDIYVVTKTGVGNTDLTLGDLIAVVDGSDECDTFTVEDSNSRCYELHKNDITNHDILPYKPLSITPFTPSTKAAPSTIDPNYNMPKDYKPGIDLDVEDYECWQSDFYSKVRGLQ